MNIEEAVKKSWIDEKKTNASVEKDSGLRCWRMHSLHSQHF